ncbi:hypothetical protein KFL_000180610 [Klebsormidium nitens]|uniref:AB hydrolase-1 domain-containing protein n=1 Tax=Klebsormidium nitens TaxID=105231 RepID=A0A1Y1HNN1_KLENI|nr:hypothetical protein KFL_000180610 [Klebsormidium nitens]|eukprot:GAQ78779.1 hypothetical protein KFL_000180610 [Klebsormidium nitens]
MSAAGGSGRPHSPIDPVESPRTQPADNLSDALGRIVGHPSGSLVGALAVAAWKGITKNTAETVELFRDLPPSDLTDTVAPEALADPDSKFVDVGKVRVHYKEYTKQGLSPTEAQRLPTILLLHGFAGSTWSFRKVMADMAEALDGHRVIAFDRPPFGLTSRPLDVQPGAPDNPYTAEGAARLMLALMDTLKIDKAVAMGHSAGAPIVLDAALLAPERITALGLLAPAVFVDKSALSRGGLYAQLRLLYTRALLSTPGVGLNYIRQMYRKRRAEVNKGAMTYADADKVTNEDIEGYLKPMMAHDWDRASLLQFQSFGFEPVGDRIKDLKVPVLILQGDLDKAVPVQAARSLAAVLRDVTETSYVELNNCGHQPMEEFPEVFVEKVTDFLQSLPDKVPAARATPRRDIDLETRVPVLGPDVTSVEAAPTSL